MLVNPKDLSLMTRECNLPDFEKEFAFLISVLLFLWVVVSLVAVSKVLQAIHIIEFLPSSDLR